LETLANRSGCSRDRSISLISVSLDIGASAKRVFKVIICDELKIIQYNIPLAILEKLELTLYEVTNVLWQFVRWSFEKVNK
jgi:hypothetical protein